MQINTKYFGEIDYDENMIIRFENGLFGFETENEFLLLPFEGSDGTMLCLQSMQTAGLAFVVMDPFALKPDYAPVLQPKELEALGVERSQDLHYYTLCVVRRPVADSTVNLKCPVAINGDTLAAAQVILETDLYHMRHCLSEFAAEGTGAQC